jgi:hypothetical protein
MKHTRYSEKLSINVIVHSTACETVKKLISTKEIIHPVTGYITAKHFLNEYQFRKNKNAYMTHFNV